jgi:lipopolysaccharide/colanic/teichoic acid biosynthesis glycosyltransferase
VKRGIDIVLGAALFVLLLPVMLFASALVAADVGFPILFWQKRPGLYGKPFRLYKFRTMRKAGRKFGEGRLAHKSGDKKRTSQIGKWIRHLRLDELPQLLHIIAGTMSFVGPRPLLPDDQPKHGEVRLSVRPGATGWAQIHGGDALEPKEKLVLDVWYIRHMSLWLDIQIMLRTLFVVLKEDAKQRETHGQL